MGTICKNCPLKNIHKETGENCTIAFAMKYGNSCVNLDIADITPSTEVKKTSEKENVVQKKPRKSRSTNGKARQKDTVRVSEVCD